MTECTITSIPDHEITGDALYAPRVCDPAFVHWAWNAFGFHSDHWSNGFGFEDVCNIDLPLCRTLNAIWLLRYSVADYWNEEWGYSMLHWASRYVAEQIDDLQAKCEDTASPGTPAATFHGFLGLGRRVELYLPFFYGVNVPIRAAILVHEARHLGGKSHNANFPRWSPSAGRWGADSSWDYQGAWMFGTLYLWWFYAAATRTTPALRESARQWANVFIDHGFETHPGFSIA